MMSLEMPGFEYSRLSKKWSTSSRSVDAWVMSAQGNLSTGGELSESIQSAIFWKAAVVL